MHTGRTEKYVKNYKKLDKATPDSRLIVSFSTSPDKVNKLKPFINSLLDQTVRVDEIAFNLSHGVEYKIPDEMKNYMLIHKTGKNYGNGNGIIPTLLREKEGNTKILVVEPDKVYGKDFIEEVLEQAKNESLVGKGWILIELEDVSPNVAETEDLYSSFLKNPKKGKYSQNYKIWNY